MGWFTRKKPEFVGPDYSGVDSLDKAQALVEQGELAPMLLLPEIFGGEERAENLTYVPPFVVDLKSSFDANVISPLATEGQISRYSAEPEYSGRSFVPIAIKIIASDPGNITHEITIWGEALNRPVA